MFALYTRSSKSRETCDASDAASDTYSLYGLRELTPTLLASLFTTCFASVDAVEERELAEEHKQHAPPSRQCSASYTPRQLILPSLAARAEPPTAPLPSSPLPTKPSLPTFDVTTYPPSKALSPATPLPCTPFPPKRLTPLTRSSSLPLSPSPLSTRAACTSVSLDAQRPLHRRHRSTPTGPSRSDLRRWVLTRRMSEPVVSTLRHVRGGFDANSPYGGLDECDADADAVTEDEDEEDDPFAASPPPSRASSAYFAPSSPTGSSSAGSYCSSLFDRYGDEQSSTLTDDPDEQDIAQSCWSVSSEEESDSDEEDHFALGCEDVARDVSIRTKQREDWLAQFPQPPRVSA
ncbi:hypothetical protein JCM10207_000317 [Rhodosporidiobolus poonsookiae]